MAVDVNNDGTLSSLDVLLVINYLSRNSISLAGGESNLMLFACSQESTEGMEKNRHQSLLHSILVKILIHMLR